MSLKMMRKQLQRESYVDPCINAAIAFLAHLVYQPKSLYNHALSVVVGVTVTVGVSVGITVVCVQSS